MKKLLNTLYVTTQGAYLRQEGETVVASSTTDVRRLPIGASGIVVLGSSPATLSALLARGVLSVSLSIPGIFQAAGNSLLGSRPYLLRPSKLEPPTSRRALRSLTS